jgi:nucleoside-diphosphate-sugar epimerase
MVNLVIGSEGFLGRNLCNYLRDIGDVVVEFDIVTNIENDARNKQLDLSNIDRVYLLAWDVGGAKYLGVCDQLEQLLWNNSILSNILPQLYDIPFVFISSQLSDRCDTVYGVQKRYGEVWTKLTKNGISVRLWNIYGYPEKYSIRSHIVSDFVKQALDTGEINMMTTGEEERQFIHIDDVCSALVKSFDIKDRSITYDISSFYWVKIYDIASVIKKYTNCKINIGKDLGETVIIENNPPVPDWYPKISLDDGIKKMIEIFYEKN